MNRTKINYKSFLSLHFFFFCNNSGDEFHFDNATLSFVRDIGFSSGILKDIFCRWCLASGNAEVLTTYSASNTCHNMYMCVFERNTDSVVLLFLRHARYANSRSHERPLQRKPYAIVWRTGPNLPPRLMIVTTIIII